MTSNPFEYAQVLASEGRDLNPMLQDVGLIIHPPLLYLGYVGYAAILAFALAALLGKQPMSDWYVVARSAAFFAWGTLTLGILVGSWWAYNELGWAAGGFGTLWRTLLYSLGLLVLLCCTAVLSQHVTEAQFGAPMHWRLLRSA